MHNVQQFLTAEAGKIKQMIAKQEHWRSHLIVKMRALQFRFKTDEVS